MKMYMGHKRMMGNGLSKQKERVVPGVCPYVMKARPSTSRFVAQALCLILEFGM